MGLTRIGSVDKEGQPALISRAVKCNGLIYTQGVTPGRDAQGNVLEGITAQTESIFSQLKAIVEEAGGSLGTVMKVNIYMTDLSHFREMNTVYRKFFPENAPARTTVGITALVVPEFLIEVEMVAAENAQA